MEAYSAVYQPRLELTEEQVWEEVEEWVNALIEEGYDLSDYTWEEMYEAYIEEARAEGVKPYKPQPLKPLPQAKPLSGQRGDGSGYKDRTGKTEGPLITVNPGNPEEARKALEKTKQKPHTRTGNPTRIMSPNLSTTREVDAVRGMVQGKAINNPTASSLPKGSSAKPKLSREIIRRPQAEEVDVYDVILSHLLDEGYASSVDAAEAIMVNMSEDWRDIIIEEILDEANGRAQRRSAARGMITHQTKIGTMTKGVDPKNRIGPEGYLRHRGETEPKPTSELRNTSPAGRRRSEARDIINKRQTNLRTMTRDVDPGDRTGPEGYLRHMGKTRG
jgi:hypothetical protein